MTDTPLLTLAEVDAWLAEYPDWDLDGGKLHRRFEFPDFTTAFAFMTAVALVAERSNHHPEWSNVYNRVEVWMTTHDAGGITAKDIAMAKAMEGFRS